MSRQYVALSGLAMVLIVLHHSIDLQVSELLSHGHEIAYQWQNLILVMLHRSGKPAVPLFLFISGSFIAYAARGNPPKLSWHTARSSILRLLWPYLVWSMVFYLLVFVQRGEAQSPLGYVKNLLVGYPFHFIPLLIFYYAISPLLAPLSRRFGLALLLVIGAYQVVLIMIEYPGTLGITLPSWADYLSPPILGGTLALWAIYFPLGMVIGLNLKQVKPVLRRFVWVLAAVTILFYALDVLDTAALADFPAAVHIYPLTLVLMAPLVSRNAIPAVKSFEAVGKNTYGVYLTHLIVIDLALLVIYTFAPWLLPLPLLTVAIVFVLALGIPMLVMDLMARGRARSVYRYMFG